MTDGFRAQKRKNIVYYLEIHDEETGKPLGRLVDMTTKGLKMVSEEPIEVNRLFRLRVDLPEGYFMQSTLALEAQSMWCTKDINKDYYVTGFSALSPDLSDQGIIDNLISHLSFND